VDFGDINTYAMAIEALNMLLHDHCAPFMQFGDIKYLVLLISSTRTTIMKMSSMQRPTSSIRWLL